MSKTRKNPRKKKEKKKTNRKEYDPIVSIKMPSTLINAINQVVDEEHYLDFSEAIRSIVRRGCLKYTNPISHEVKELKENLKQDLILEEQMKQKQALIDELKRLLSGMPGGDAL